MKASYAVILPAGIKLKPFRYTCTFRDYRHHNKIQFNKAMESVDWSPVLEPDDVNKSVNTLQDIIHDLMNKHFSAQ